MRRASAACCGAARRRARAEAIGFPTFRYKLLLFVLAGADRRRGRRADGQPAGLREPQRAALDAVGHADGDGDPRRRGHAVGRCAGRGALLLLEEACSAPTPSTGSSGPAGWRCCWPWCCSRQGLVGCWGAARAAARGGRRAGTRGAAARGAAPGKRFGGVVPPTRSTCRSHAGEVHALIGPNGAGKTTLIAQLSGACLPDAARSASTARHHAAGAARARRARARALVPDHAAVPRFSVLDNLRSRAGAPARACASGARWRATTALRRSRARCCERGGPGGRADAPGGALSHGEQRRSRWAWRWPRAPAAAARRADGRHGPGGVASAWSALIAGACAGEHGAAGRARRGRRVPLADRMSVLVNGRPIATGAPAAVRSDPRCARPTSATRRHDGAPPDGPAAAPGAAAGRGGLSAAYGASQVLFGVDCGAPGEVVACSAATAWARPPVRRSSGCCAPRAAACGSGQRHDGQPARPHRAQLGLGLVPEGRQVFPT
jgi:branched-chain amino acid transport system ATP-binding protein